MIRKLRTIGQILKFIKKEDSESQISRYFIEDLMIKHKVYYIKSGNKYLLDLDEVLNIINSNTLEEKELR